jgi:hypothetical protein
MNLSGNCVEFLSIKDGFGRHMQFLTDEQVMSVKMLNHLALFFASLALWTVKLSICFFILSLIRGTHQRSTRVVWVLVTMTSLAHGCQLIF